ncbi:MAG: hypothetical protein WC716_09590 [Chitinophagaceae bacterium]|jgi:hypothetical protein
MLQFKKGTLPDLPFELAIKKPIPVRCVQINEPFEVETLEGTFYGKAGDYLIIGIENEMYPCEQGIFKRTYDIQQ